MTLWFIRHAESEGNILGNLCPVEHNIPLTENVRSQTINTYKYLKQKGIQITDIYSSPLVRTKDTAESLAQVFDL